MKEFASYLANLPKTPLVEAVKALYESTTSTQIAPSEQEIFDTVIADIKFKLNACWDRTVSEMRKKKAFKFHCIVYDRFHNIIDGIAPDVYITFLHDTPQFANEPNSIEIVSDNPALVQCYMATQDNGITSEMKAEVTAAILDLIRKNTQYIKERIHEILATDISEHTDMENTTVLWRIDDVLSSESPDYKMMPFLQFAHRCLNKSPIDALKYLAELVDTCGGKVASTDYTAIAKLASYGNWTTAQVINYLTGVYNIGNYLGCSGVLQLNNGMLYSDGYVYDRNDVNKYLKHLYDTTFYEDAVEEWNDHDYRRESLMHELRGNRYPLPREHTVHRIKNGEAPEYRTWVSTVDQSTGMRPIDTVLDQLKNGGDAKHIKPSKNLDWLISQSGTLPSVESSRKIETALYENTHTDRAVRVNKLLTEFLKDFRVEVEKFIRSKLEEEIQRLIKHRVLDNRNLTDKERDQQINEIRQYEVVAFSAITLTCAGMKCTLLFDAQDGRYSACCTRDKEIYINVYKCIDDAEPEYANYDYDTLFSDQQYEETENDRIYTNMCDNLLNQCKKWNKILVTSQNVDDIIKALIDMSRSASLVDTLRHELTHADQRNHPDQNSYSNDEFDYGRYMAKHMPSVDRSSDSYIVKYHSIFPWEIDAKIQERVTDIVKKNSNASITDIAKEIYDWAVYKIKNLGLDTPERRKQCWQTAVALTRAALYATKEHGTVPQEWTGHSEEEQQSMSKLIDHLGDYPV